MSAQRPAFVDESLDALDDERRLLARVERLHEEGLFVVGPRRAQLLVEMPALGLGGQHSVGKGQNRWRRAIIGLDAVDLRAGMPVGKGNDVLEVCAAPGIDALRVVADRHHAVVRADDVDDLRLERVGVLVLVDQRRGGSAAGGRRPRRATPRRSSSQYLKQIVVIDHALLAFALAVGGGKSADVARRCASCCG